MRTMPPLVVVLLPPLLTTACALPPDQLAVDAGYPADFAMSLFYDSGDDRWVAHLHPDRDLHAASGSGVTLQTHAPRTVRLTPAQMADVYRLAEAALEKPPAADDKAKRPLQSARLELTANDRAQAADFAGPTAPPALDVLAQYLIRLRGG